MCGPVSDVLLLLASALFGRRAGRGGGGASEPHPSVGGAGAEPRVLGGVAVRAELVLRGGGVLRGQPSPTVTGWGERSKVKG